MPKVRLQEGTRNRADGPAPAGGITPKPLRVAGLVVRKADLIAALQVYVSGLSDVQVTEDGQYFWLLLSEGGRDESSAAG